MRSSVGGYMKKSAILILSGEELMELQRIMLDDDKEEALHFPKKYLAKKVAAAVLREGH